MAPCSACAPAPAAMRQPLPRLMLLAMALPGAAASCGNRYDAQQHEHQSSSCAELVQLGFSCDGDFCHADAAPDDTDGAEPPTTPCPYSGYCDLECGLCSEAPPPPPLAASDCLDAVPLELQDAYPDCAAMVASLGCDGQVRREQQMQYDTTLHEYVPSAHSETISVCVGSLCRRTCRSCCTDSWAVESGLSNFCGMQIASGEYGCSTHFCHEASCAEAYPEFTGKCDATCHLCEAREESAFQWSLGAGDERKLEAVSDAAVSRVCTACMIETVTRLSALRSRFAMGSNGEAAAALALLEILVAEKAALGARVTTARQVFTGLDPRHSLANLIVRLDGAVNTTESIIIGGHFDCTNHRPGPLADETKPAPGADDNGSGVAGVLEILRVITRMVAVGEWRPRVNILFVFFGAEEQGSIGSHRYGKHTHHHNSTSRDRSERLPCGWLDSAQLPVVRRLYPAAPETSPGLRAPRSVSLPCYWL